MYPTPTPARRRCLVLLLALLVSATAGAQAPAAGEAPPADSRPAQSAQAAPDPEQIEKDLQSLNWPQFKAVVMAVPKLKADVDAYGPLGWQYVQSNYKTYKWRKSVGKLDEEQRRQLADLIEQARRDPKLSRSSDQR